MASEAEVASRLASMLITRNEDGSIDHAATHEELPRSDMSAADFIIRLYPGIFTFSVQSRLWRFWDGTIHSAAEDGNVPHVVRQLARAYKEAMREIRRDAIRSRAGDVAEAEAAAEYERTWRKHRAYRDAVWMNPDQAAGAAPQRQRVAVRHSLRPGGSQQRCHQRHGGWGFTAGA